MCFINGVLPDFISYLIKKHFSNNYQETYSISKTVVWTGLACILHLILQYTGILEYHEKIH